MFLPPNNNLKTPWSMDKEIIYDNEIERLSSILVNLHIDEARKINLTPYYNCLRVVKSNGNPCVVTSDFRVDRINIELEKNIITKIKNIG